MTKVITYGTFDLFHEGHYRLLQRAKKLGDYLIVGVTTEEYDRARGKLNVIDSLMTRMENVKKTGFADEIIIEESTGQKFHDIQKYKVDIFTVGSDWTGQFDYLKDYCKVVYLERTKNISSTMLRAQNKRIQRIGIIGTGRIAERFIPEAKLVSGVSTQGVYNPHIESAVRFAKKWEIDTYRSLEEFYAAVDAVYIASPHETHYGYIKSALEHGKHVLCEKPMVLDKVQAEEVFDYAKERGLVLIEGIKTAYCPGFSSLLGVACSGLIGSVRNVEACFTKLENPNFRELTDLQYGGSFTELGSHVMLPIIKLFGKEYEELTFHSINDERGLDLFTRAVFKYPNGMATATCGLGVKSEGRLLIAGTKGYIVAEAPWWKTTYYEVHYEDPGKVDKFSERFLGEGLRYEVSDFLSMINGSSKNEFKLTRGESIAMAGVMGKFLKENRYCENMGA
ncbi:MAG: Gfo/Idh/MocA family oxidoreductase [Dorea sp.]|jgi:glycerol-3-phosphate cytidylyltransferase|nr:Gfo/Idh/MocA family oxidoreductase [Dorea sp.]